MVKISNANFFTERPARGTDAEHDGADGDGRHVDPNPGRAHESQHGDHGKQVGRDRQRHDADGTEQQPDQYEDPEERNREARSLRFHEVVELLHIERHEPRRSDGRAFGQVRMDEHAIDGLGNVADRLHLHAEGDSQQVGPSQLQVEFDLGRHREEDEVASYLLGRRRYLASTRATGLGVHLGGCDERAWPSSS